MGKYGLICPIRKANPYRCALKAAQQSKTAPNLLKRRFREFGPRQVLLTDISYLFYGNGQRSYISTIIDAYTKQVLAYALSPSLELDFVLDTINMLQQNHGVSLNQKTIINSDQGVHYRSIKFMQIVKDLRLRQSMSRRANCWDNAPQESFFGHMKDEINLSSCQTYEQVAATIDDWISYYNNDRCQWALAKLTPNEYYEYTRTNIYPLNRSAT